VSHQTTGYLIYGIQVDFEELNDQVAPDDDVDLETWLKDVYGLQLIQVGHDRDQAHVLVLGRLDQVDVEGGLNKIQTPNVTPDMIDKTNQALEFLKQLDPKRDWTEQLGWYVGVSHF
jgi:hypothetical protein